MRNPGLEPGSLAALEPESSASANSASSAGNYLQSTIPNYYSFISICQVIAPSVTEYRVLPQTKFRSDLVRIIFEFPKSLP